MESTIGQVTPASVAAMADRKVDALFAELLGCRVKRSLNKWGDLILSEIGERGVLRYEDARIPHFSTDPAAAAEAVAAVLVKGAFISIQGEPKAWFVEIRSEYFTPHGAVFQARASTECRAKAEASTLALAAMQEGKDGK